MAPSVTKPRNWMPVYATAIPVRVCSVPARFSGEVPKEYEERCRSELERAGKPFIEFLAKRRIKLASKAMDWKSGWIYVPAEILLELALERVTLGCAVTVKAKKQERVCVVCEESFMLGEPYLRIPLSRILHFKCATQRDLSFRS